MFKPLYHYVSYKVVSSLIIDPIVEAPCNVEVCENSEQTKDHNKVHSKLSPKIALLSMVTFALGVSSFGLNVAGDDERATYILVVVLLSIIECLSILSIMYPDEDDVDARDVDLGTSLRRTSVSDRTTSRRFLNEYNGLLSSSV